MADLRFLYEMDLPPRAVNVYQYLYIRANGEGQCWPAVPTIARALKLADKTVRRAIGDLKKAGLLECEQRYRGNGGKSSLLFQIRKTS